MGWPHPQAIVLPVSNEETAMITRRDFIVSSAAALTAIPACLTAKSLNLAPLQAEGRRRKLFVRRTPDWDFILYSNGPNRPQPLIKRSVIKRRFGDDVYNTLRQRDHWAMIKAGWFSAHDQFLPQPVRDPEYDIWQAYYRPEVEAHDLLEDTFFDGTAPWWGANIQEYGLTLAEHPNTPRYATAKVGSLLGLPALAAAINERTPHVSLEYGGVLKRQSWEDIR